MLSACAAASPAAAPLVDTSSFSGEAEEVRAVSVEAEDAVARDGDTGSSFGAQEQVQQERLVIYNANLALVVDDPVESLDTISDLATSIGGFVFNSNLYESS